VIAESQPPPPGPIVSHETGTTGKVVLQALQRKKQISRTKEFACLNKGILVLLRWGKLIILFKI